MIIIIPALMEYWSEAIVPALVKEIYKFVAMKKIVQIYLSNRIVYFLVT